MIRTHLLLVLLSACSVGNGIDDILGTSTHKMRPTFHVRVADDSTTARMLLDVLCNQARCPDYFVAVKSYKTGNALICELEPKVTLVVTDLNMPNGDGLKVLRKAQACGIDVVVITAKGADFGDVSRKILSAGAKAVIGKADIQDRLPDVVRGILHAKL